MDHPVENLAASVAGCRHEASFQAQGAAALDAKLIAMFAFMGAVAGLLLTLGNGLDSYRWVLLVGVAGSIVLALLGLVGGRDLEAGPDPIRFYDDYGRNAPADFSSQLIGDFAGRLAVNNDRLEVRRKLLSGSITWAAMWGIGFGLVQAIA